MESTENLLKIPPKFRCVVGKRFSTSFVFCQREHFKNFPKNIVEMLTAKLLSHKIFKHCGNLMLTVYFVLYFINLLNLQFKYFTFNL